MKNIKIIAITISLSLMFCNCEELLEEEPFSVVAPSVIFGNPDNIEIAVAGIYNAMSQRGIDGNTFGNYAHGLIMMGMLGTDHVRSGNNLGNRFSQMDLFNYSATSQLPTHVWNLHYIGINRANTVIVNTEPLLGTGLDDDRLNSLLGEAKFMRALMYLNLVRFYGDVPLKLTETNSLTAEDVIGIARTPSEQVYQQIADDLIFAAEHLPRQQELDGRVTSGAAYGLLAKTYVYWATAPLNDTSKWQLAADAARQVIDSGQYRLLDNFPDIFGWQNEGNDEIIFTVKYGSVEGQWGVLGGAGGFLGFSGANFNSTGPVTGQATQVRQYAAEQYLWESWDPLDQRRDWTVPAARINNAGDIVPLTADQSSDPNSFNFGLAKFRRDASWIRFQSPIDVPILRYADVLLLFAEATANASGGLRQNLMTPSIR
ncbi:RagB/SusD family nutrient uptake outer membrane protein [Flagellimonas sp. CMM7]|uniref:RagB/SusD family nutrient uptake outer membrane protein n=1 Tax=Flagellimonas sp. CMM7 TaxID=2654676 RepID=UPI001F430BD5|nr:RagB/SusD family nutrient uptake outer membrane protein [Flagellimonas sp. CMM7]UII78733.1 RagB/SusD family nutrient uptake outer membrane protein [Flagellimonas sp. CMM7]